jgi:hypothetical protein
VNLAKQINAEGIDHHVERHAVLLHKAKTHNTQSAILRRPVRAFTFGLAFEAARLD